MAPNYLVDDLRDEIMPLFFVLTLATSRKDKLFRVTKICLVSQFWNFFLVFPLQIFHHSSFFHQETNKLNCAQVVILGLLDRKIVFHLPIHLNFPQKINFFSCLWKTNLSPFGAVNILFNNKIDSLTLLHTICLYQTEGINRILHCNWPGPKATKQPFCTWKYATF